MSQTIDRPTTPDLAPAVRALSDAASTPSLVALSYALRHPETWPEGFKWHYASCRTCAIGLAMRLWGLSMDKVSPGRSTDRIAAGWFSMPLPVAERIFIGMWDYVPGGTFDDVTPIHVADAIDAHLAAQVSA